MPNTLLFATNNEGRIYALSTGHSVWKEFQYLGLEFKKVSAVQHFMWAIGGDRQVYVHVHGLDIPIRMKEESYENERWFPIEGFANRLLPTDRTRFSNMDGTENRAIELIRLPSMAWQWEGEWQLDCNLNGEPLDHDGWTYAIDFPAKFYSKKSWNSCVRRRKWIRYRRYSALNSWCAVAPLHKDPTEEPFIDVAIGGNFLPDSQSGSLSVWAITAHGRVMYRTGVSSNSPEGQRWTAISTPTGCEILQISVGATGLVWAILYNGKALVRTGIRSDNITGDNWAEVHPPGENLKMIQVSVGTNAVWCVTNDNHVWFRRGIKGEISGISEDAAVGNFWVEMVGNISYISVASNDQVFAIGSEDRYLYYRSGVTPTDLTGKKWRQIQCPMQFSRASSTASLSSKRSGSESPAQSYRSINNLYKDKEKARVETSAIIENIAADGEASFSAPNFRQKHGDVWSKHLNSPPSSLNEKVSNRYKMKVMEQTASSAPSENVSEVSGKYFETQLKNPRAWSPVRSVGSMVGTEAHPESDSTVFETDSNRGSCIFGEEDDQSGAQYWAEFDSVWTICSAGAVLFEPNQPPNWFKDAVATETAIDLLKEWRLKLIEKLKGRLSTFEFDATKYEKAVELSSWVKSGEAKAAKNSESFDDCLIELEWLTSAALGSGTLTVLNLDGVTTKMQLSLSEITCVMCCSEPGNPRIALYAPRLPSDSSPLKLQFSCDNEMEDWLSHLTSVCCELNEVQGRPSNDSRWITNGLGDVFCFDPTNHKSVQFNNEVKLYEQKTDMLGAETPYNSTLFNGLTAGSILEIDGCIFDDASQIRFDLKCHSTLKTRFIVEKMRHVACHLNPRFNEKTIVLNSMENSEWMTEVRTDNMVFSPGTEFKLQIRCETTGLRFYVDDEEFTFFEHRIAPEAVNSLYVSGRVKLYKIKYYSPTVIVPLRDMFWRQMGGHMRKVVCSKRGVVWGIGYDNTAWVYTNGWGGLFLKGINASSIGINAMTDTHNYYIYENQRWNPLSGYTAHGLPTDRHMWSDASGKKKRSKENSKLLSSHWHWISDWMIDFHTPGGVDRDGWQYAVDFPASYHAKKNFTDYVRRRRWYRKCRLTTSGPWHEIGQTKIIDVSLQPQYDDDAEFKVWAVASNGDALFRRGVTESSSSGSAWDHIVANHPLVSISSSYANGVWAIGRNGSAYRRCGITTENVCGDVWQAIDPPKGVTLKQISVGAMGIWAIDSQGQMVARREVSKLFPEGSHWQILPNVLNDPPHEEGKIGFKSVSVGDDVWAVSNSGYVCKRSGVTLKNPAGTGWNFGISANFNYIS